jgi:uncharacterized protein (TIGR02452 family)
MCFGTKSDDEEELPEIRPKPMSLLARTRFFISVARANRNLIRSMLPEDERLRNSPQTTKLYPDTQPLAPDVILKDPADPASHPDDRSFVHVVPGDSLNTALELGSHGVRDLLVLNMANSRIPGGMYTDGAGAQEEALCRRTTLYHTLANNPKFYPIPHHGAIYSPDVLVLRKSDDERCALLEGSERWWTSIVSVAAIFQPPWDQAGGFARVEDQEEMRERIKTVLRVAVLEGKRNLVLGALGCGIFRNPPLGVAQLFKEVLTDSECLGAFEGVWFAIMDRAGSRNFQIFSQVLEGVALFRT